MAHLIAQHIAVLDVPIHDVVAETDSHTICCFSGDIIQYACRKKDVIGDNFTDHQYLRYPSAYISVDMAKLIVGKLPNGNGLRNYSFYADSDDLTLLKREEIIEKVLSGKKVPFIIGVTFANKKHIAFKTTPQYDSNKFSIFTDVGECLFDMSIHLPLLEIMQAWYTIVPEKQHTEQQPTYFNKAQIEGAAEVHYQQIQQYGEEKYFEENAALEKHRYTQIFKVLLFILNKSM